MFWSGPSRPGAAAIRIVFDTGQADHLVPAFELLSVAHNERHVEQGLLHGSHTCPLLRASCRPG